MIVHLLPLPRFLAVSVGSVAPAIIPTALINDRGGDVARGTGLLGTIVQHGPIKDEIILNLLFDEKYESQQFFFCHVNKQLYTF